MLKRIIIAALITLQASIACAAASLSFPLVGPALTGAAFGTGASFNSAGSTLFTPAASVLNFSGAFTRTIALKFTSPGNNVAINFMSNVNAGSTTGADIHSNGSNAVGPNFLFRTYASGQTGNCGGTGSNAGPQGCTRLSWINDNSLHVIQEVYDGSCIYAYIDGKFYDRSPCSQPYTPGNIYWSFGPTSAQGPFNLTYYSVRIYNRVLSAKELLQQGALTALGLAPNSGSLQTGLVADWEINGSAPYTDSVNSLPLELDSTPPTAAITAPTGTVSGSQNLPASCSDTIGCISLQYTIDGVNFGAAQTTSPYTLAWNTANYVDGSHVIGCTATNVGGVTASCTTSTVTTSNSVAAQAYYVAAAGSDSNNCKTTGTACASVTHVIATYTFHGGDSILVNGGDTITGCFTLANIVGSPTYPFTLGSYGTGTGTVQGNCGDGGATVTGTIHLNNVSGYVQNNLNCAAYTATETSAQSTCVWVENTSSTLMSWVTIENSDISGAYVSDANAGAGHYSIDIALFGDAITNGSCAGMAHVRLTNLFIHGTQGVSSKGQFGVTGFGCGGNGTQNIIDVQVQGVDTYNIGGNTTGQGNAGGGGITAGGWENSSITASVGHDIGYNAETACGGPYAIWADNSDKITISAIEGYNVSPQTLSTWSGCDQGGGDFDGGVTNSTYEYSYFHHNAGPGSISLPCQIQSYWGPNIYRYNIYENNSLGGSISGGTGAELALGGLCNSATPAYLVYAYNNSIYMGTVYSASGKGDAGITFDISGFDSPWAAGSIAANNIVQIAGNNQDGHAVFLADLGNGLGHMTVINNDFYNSGAGTTQFTNANTGYSSFAAWASATGQPTSGTILTNPNFTSPGGNTTCYTSGTPVDPGASGCPAGYVLASTASPAVGTGLDLTQAPYSLNVGTRDYFNNTIPHGHGTGFNIGADGGYP